MGQLKSPARVGPFQADGQQHQWGQTGLGVCAVVQPLQHSQGQKQGVDSLFLDEGIGQTVGGQQAAVQIGGFMHRVQLEITAAVRSGAVWTGFWDQHGDPFLFVQRVDDLLWRVALQPGAPGAEQPIVEQRVAHPQVQKVPARGFQLGADGIGMGLLGRG